MIKSLILRWAGYLAREGEGRSAFRILPSKPTGSRPDGLRVTCSPRDPRFADANPTEADGFFSGRNNPEYKSSGREFKPGVPSLRFQAC
jgi:hypothetical protein